jgi:hypothetical protein
MLDYVLVDCLLTKDVPNDRNARVVNVRSYSEIDLAEAISKRNMGISKAEALAMLEATSEIELDWLKDGSSINLRLAHFHPSITGVYKEGEYPKEANIRITPSKEVAEAAGKISLRHVEAVATISVDFVDDVKSATTNAFITKGGNVKITGHNIKIAATKIPAPGVGIEFISLEDPEAIYKVPAGDIVINNPSELIIVAPQMVTGEVVQLKITTQYSGSQTLVKTPHTVTFSKPLTVK